MFHFLSRFVCFNSLFLCWFFHRLIILIPNCTLFFVLRRQTKMASVLQFYIYASWKSYTFDQFVTSLRLTILFEPKEHLNLAHLFLTKSCLRLWFETLWETLFLLLWYVYVFFHSFYHPFAFHLPPSLFLSISAHLLFLACWFLYAPNVLYLPMHSVSIHWAAEGMHSG